MNKLGILLDHGAVVIHLHRFLFLTTALLMVLCGHLFVLQTTPGGTGYLSIGGDAKIYAAMVEQGVRTAPAPFRYRPLVPLLASVIPTSAYNALRLITYACLFVTYAAILFTCTRLNIPGRYAILGLLLVYSSTWSLYAYHNPYLTDAFGLMVLALMLLAFVSDSFLLFALVSLVGITARETTIFLVPLWMLAHNRKQGAWLTITALLVLGLLHILLPTGIGLPAFLKQAFLKSGWTHPLQYLIGLGSTWSFLWFLGLIGLLILPAEHFRPMAIAFTLTGVGAFLASLLAFDTTRMFTVLFPLLAVACAQVYVFLGSVCKKEDGRSSSALRDFEMAKSAPSTSATSALLHLLQTYLPGRTTGRFGTGSQSERQEVQVSRPGQRIRLHTPGRSGWFWLPLTGLTAIQLLVSSPNRLFTDQSWVILHPWPRVGLLLLGMGYAIYILVHCRRAVKQQLSRNWNLLRSHLT